MQRQLVMNTMAWFTRLEEEERHGARRATTPLPTLAAPARESRTTVRGVFPVDTSSEQGVPESLVSLRCVSPAERPTAPPPPPGYGDSSIPVPLVSLEQIPPGEIEISDELVLLHIDGERSVAELAHVLRRSSEEIESALRRLVETGAIVVGVLRR